MKLNDKHPAIADIIRINNEMFRDMTGIDTMGIRMKLKTTMSRVAEDKLGRHLPAKLIGAIMSKRGRGPDKVGLMFGGRDKNGILFGEVKK